ncbi:ankyrin [Aspergillus bombycis]|uniref:Ankyrin n=1 Tax=Aspergillus bombycis TaxID=109264 RepID=A0A1F8A8M5_9EURO|nr:ankyrin [Aspergillus bombycis]OGM48047.1 ankyrin [Aspergillus bombycis]
MSSSSKDRLLPSIQALLYSCARATILASEIQFEEDLSTSQDQALAVLINLDLEIKRSLRYILQRITLPIPLFTSVLLGSTWALDLFERRLRLYRLSRHGRQYVCNSWTRLIEMLQQYTMNLQQLTSTSALDAPDAISDASSLQRLFNSQNDDVQQELEAQIRYEGQPWDVSPDTPDYLDVQQEYPPSTYATPPSSITDGDSYDDLPAIPGPPPQAPSLLSKEQHHQAAIDHGRERERATIYETLKRVWLPEGTSSEKQRSSYLMGAIKLDSVDGVNLLLDLGADVNQQCENNLPLCLAAKLGHDRIVETLLERGAEIDKLSAYGSTALLSAAGTGRVSTIALLLDRKANTEARSTSTFYLGYTPLMRAVKSGRMDAVRVLVERGANVATQNDAGESLLHIAMRDGRKEIIEQVLRLQPRIGVADENGNTELHVAATQGLVDVCRQLVGQMKSLMLTGNRNKETPLHCAVNARRCELVKLFLSEGAIVEWPDKNEKTPLHLAVKTGCQEIVQLLLNAIASPCRKDQDGKTPIHYAVDLSSKDLLQLLAEKMPSVDAKYGNKQPPLHYAVKSLNVEIVCLLLSHKATANCKDRAGKVPLEYIMELPQSDEETAIRLIREFLRAHEKGQTLTSTCGFPALSQAARHNRVQLIEEFCKHDPYLANERPAADSGFEPPLHEAIKGGHRKSVDKLCEFPDTDKDIVDSKGNTPLHQAIKNWQDGLLAMLIHCGADKDRPHKANGLPPLHFAVQSQSLKKVQELLNAKADPEKRIKGEQCQWCKDHKRPPGMNSRCVLQAIPVRNREHEYAGINRVLTQTLLKSGHPRPTSSDSSVKKRKRRLYTAGSRADTPI